MLRTYRRSERRATRFDLSCMCRMCLSQNLPADKLVDIFVEEPVTNVSVIEFCTGIECEEGDGLPPRMCYDCYNSMTTFFAFKKMCLASDKYCKAFRDAPTIIESPPSCENVESRDEPTDELSLAENNDMGLLETDCIHPGAPDEVLSQISKCEEDYQLAHPSKEHETVSLLPTLHWREEIEEEEEEVEDEEEEFLPQFEHRQQISNEPVATFETLESAEREQMASCDQSVLLEPSLPVRPTSHVSDISTHAEATPERLEPPDESVCVDRPESLEGVPVAASRKSIILKMEQKKYYCDLCSKAFLSPNSLKRHLKNHGSAQHKCPECGKEFHQRSSMKRHLLLHSDRRFVCSSCSKVLLSREGLKCHIRTQHTERTGKDYYKYKCSHCSKTFAHSSGLSRHMAIHRGISYECDSCGKKFNDSSQLKRHKLKNHPGVDSEPTKDVQNTEPLQPPPSEPSATTVS